MRSSRNPGPRRSTIRWMLTECDLDAYAVLADEFSAGSVLDTGCGTGNPRLPACRTWLGGHRYGAAAASLGVAPAQAWRRPRPLAASRCHGSAPTAGPSRDHNRERGPGLRDRPGAGRQRCGQSMRPCDRRVCWCSRAGIPRRRRGWSRTGTRPATVPSSRTHPAGRGWPGEPWRCWPCRQARGGGRRMDHRRPAALRPVPRPLRLGIRIRCPGPPGDRRKPPTGSGPAAGLQAIPGRGARRPARVHRLGAHLPGRGGRPRQPAAGQGDRRTGDQPRPARPRRGARRPARLTSPRREPLAAVPYDQIRIICAPWNAPMTWLHAGNIRRYARIAIG